MNDLKLWIDILGVVLELAIIAYFLHGLFGPMRGGLIFRMGCYAVLGITIWGCSYFLPQAYQRTVAYSILVSSVAAIGYAGHWTIKFFSGYLLVLISSSLEYLVHVLFMLMDNQTYSTGRSDLDIYIKGLILSKILMAIFIGTLTSAYKRSQQKGQITRIDFFLLMIFPVASAGVFLSVYTVFIQNGQIEGIGIVITANILLLLANFAVFILFERQRKANELAIQYSLATQRLHDQQEYLQKLTEHYQDLRRFRHDINNIVAAVSAYIKDEHLPEALQTLEKMGEIITNPVVERTGILPVDAILSAKLEEANQIETPLAYQVNLAVPIIIETMDLAMILANGLDNALEASAKIVDKSQRRIDCQITTNQQNWLTIVIENTVTVKVPIEGQTLYTDKKDKANHGIGLDNIRRIVQTYHGQMRVESTEKKFILSVLLANNDQL